MLCKKHLQRKMKQVRTISLIIVLILVIFFGSIYFMYQTKQREICQVELTSEEVNTLRTRISNDILNAQTKQLIFRVSASELNALLLPSLTEQGFRSCITVSGDSLAVLLTQNPLLWFSAIVKHQEQKPFLAIEQLFLWFIPVPSSIKSNVNEQLAKGFTQFEEVTASESTWMITSIEIVDNSVFITMNNGR